jgi:hypothetical protein
MHHWGDEDFPYFNDVENAAYEIKEFCVRYGRLGGQSKEKYGTVRFYAKFGVTGFHNLTHPGWVNYAWYPKWLVRFEIYHSPKVFRALGITWFFSKWQPMVYRMAYKRALKKYPHIRKEILSCADYDEFLKGL